MRRGLNYIMTALSTQTLTVQTAGSPCVGAGIEAAPCVGYAERGYDTFHEAYTTPVAMLALAGSGALARTNTEAGGVTAGKTYREILQRMANTVVWGQIDPSNAIGSGRLVLQLQWFRPGWIHRRLGHPRLDGRRSRGHHRAGVREDRVRDRLQQRAQ